mmetsp:Transcript_9201/g.13395  ORF Transcript_9201/g.13395 Transcript_9201/m.13395 type:complete len:280 (+) Transcript_9201:69-908(+)
MNTDSAISDKYVGNKSVDAMSANKNDIIIGDALSHWIDLELDSNVGNDEVSLWSNSIISSSIASDSLPTDYTYRKHDIPGTIMIADLPSRQSSFVSVEEVSSISKGNNFIDRDTNLSTDSVSMNSGKVMDDISHFSDSMGSFDNLLHWINKEEDFREYSIPPLISKPEHSVSFDNKSMLKELGDHFLTKPYKGVTSTSKPLESTPNAAITSASIERKKEEDANCPSQKTNSSDEAIVMVHLQQLATTMIKSQASRRLLAQMNISGTQNIKSTAKKNRGK